ncbi:MAG TPA: PilZ domain-containing protein [Nitrospira sp.]|nr:PilZ domain-containing protein [Nitrospira sp.]
MISFVEFVAICSVATLTAAGASQGWDRLRRPRNRSADRVKTSGDGSGRPSAGAWHEPRDGKRYPVRCPIEYDAGAHRKMGILIDVSRRGWRATGPSSVLAGTTLSMRVFFPDAAQSVFIEEAVVRWSDGLEFGVELTQISPEDAQVLSDYLSIHYPMESSPSYALSPFSYN